MILDLPSIRHAAETRDAYSLPELVLALLDRIEELKDRDRKSAIVVRDLAEMREEAKEEVYRLRAAVCAYLEAPDALSLLALRRAVEG